MLRFASGAIHQTIYYPELKAFHVCLPSLHEQERIVAMVDAAFEGIDAAIANAEQNIANARALFEHLRDQAVAGAAENWTECDLSAAVNLISTGPFGSILHKADYVDGGSPIVNPVNIVDGRVRADHAKTVSAETIRRLGRYRLDEGDVVIGRRGEIGRCAVVEKAQVGWLCGTGCFFIRPSSRVLPEFLATILRTSRYRATLESAAIGTTMKNLSNRSLRRLRIKYPTSLNEQRQILERIAAFDDKIAGVCSN